MLGDLNRQDRTRPLGGDPAQRRVGLDFVAGLGRGHIDDHAGPRGDDQQEILLVGILELDARRSVGHQTRGRDLQPQPRKTRPPASRGGRPPLHLDIGLVGILLHLRNGDVRTLGQLDHADKETARISGNLSQQRNRILNR